ncbi:NB-ARC domain-containing protein [Streptomyces sp. NBC_01537]|uniref:BTAD domain-containing putative transcriptional regulator n=1 Tax=Streptomyces sp. NBC_01537 TaxID=2903896 RepID=UPI0038695E8D
MRFSVLGPLTVEVSGRTLPLGPLKQRLVLALLLCRPNTLVSVDLLTEAVWQEEPPRTARKNLQVYISALRKLLCEAGAGNRLVHRTGSYLLQLAEPELDALRFRTLARSGREAAVNGTFGTAARLFRQSLDVWSGPPLPELSRFPLIQAEADRLTNRYLGVCEDWAEAALESGQTREVADTLADLVEQHPSRERLTAVQMTALHRSGRQSEALAAYDGLRQHLSRELGLAPSQALETLYRAILGGKEAGSGNSSSTGTGRHADHPRHVAATLLPPDTPDFTGRRDQVRELLEAVARGGRVVLAGPPGVGKTALAVHVAHRLGEEFPDGTLLVRTREEDGSPRTGASLLAELRRLTGPADRMPDDAEQAAALWRAWLADHKALIVFDDVLDEAGVRSLLPVAEPSAAIVTARTQLAGLASAHRIEVPPYSAAEAVELLTRVLGLGRVRSDQAAAEQIVAHCGMLPLAVRVSGLKLAVLRHLPLSEFAARLADPLTMLDELVAGDIAVRHHLTNGWHDLDEAERSALHRLGLLPLSQTFTLDEAAAVLGSPPGVALRQLERLIETGAVTSPLSEVTAHTALYALPRLTHIYARGLVARDLAG